MKSIVTSTKKKEVLFDLHAPPVGKLIKAQLDQFGGPEAPSPLQAGNEVAVRVKDINIVEKVIKVEIVSVEEVAS